MKKAPTLSGEIERLRAELDEATRLHFAAHQRMERAEAELAAVQVIVESYRELIFAVGNKHPNETRHETALRYIRQAEKQDDAIDAAREQQ